MSLRADCAARPRILASFRSFASSSLLREATAARDQEVDNSQDEPVPFSAPPKQADDAPKTFKSIESALHPPVYRAVTEK